MLIFFRRKNRSNCHKSRLFLFTVLFIYLFIDLYKVQLYWQEDTSYKVWGRIWLLMVNLSLGFFLGFIFHFRRSLKHRENFKVNYNFKHLMKSNKFYCYYIVLNSGYVILSQPVNILMANIIAWDCSLITPLLVVEYISHGLFMKSIFMILAIFMPLKNWCSEICMGCWFKWTCFLQIATKIAKHCSIFKGQPCVVAQPTCLKIGSLWLHVPSDMKNSVICNDYMIQQQETLLWNKYQL